MVEQQYRLLIGLIAYFMLGVIASALLALYVVWRRRWHAATKVYFIIVQMVVYLGVCALLFIGMPIALFPLIEGWLGIEELDFRFWALMGYLAPVIFVCFWKRAWFQEVKFTGKS